MLLFYFKTSAPRSFYHTIHEHASIMLNDHIFILPTHNRLPINRAAGLEPYIKHALPWQKLNYPTLLTGVRLQNMPFKHWRQRDDANISRQSGSTKKTTWITHSNFTHRYTAKNRSERSFRFHSCTHIRTHTHSRDLTFHFPPPPQSRSPRVIGRMCVCRRGNA